MSRSRSLPLVYPLLAMLGLTLDPSARADRGARVEPEKVQRMDFENDEVTGDVLRPDGVTVGGELRGRRERLLKVRTHFLPELMASTDDL